MLYNPNSQTDKNIISDICRVSIAKAEEILTKVGGMANLCKFPLTSLIVHMTERQAKSLLAAVSLNSRINWANDSAKTIVNAEDCAKLFVNKLPSFDREFGIVSFLNRANKVISTEVIFAGSSCAVILDPKTVFKRALELNSSAIILGHNHPSGNINPSHADREVTKRFVKSGELLDVLMLDHIIVTQTGNYYSFANAGEI